MTLLRGSVYRTADRWTRTRRRTSGHIARLLDVRGMGEGVRDGGEEGSSGLLLSSSDIRSKYLLYHGSKFLVTIQRVSQAQVYSVLY